jgi:hypothetical protein
MGRGAGAEMKLRVEDGAPVNPLIHPTSEAGGDPDAQRTRMNGAPALRYNLGEAHFCFGLAKDGATIRGLYTSIYRAPQVA